MSITFGIAVFAAIGLRGGVNVAIDGKGNLALLAGVGGGGYTAAGGSFRPGTTATWTSAETVDQLAGWSVQFGGQLGFGPAVNAEGILFRSDGKPFWGVSAGGAAALELPFPGEAHLTAEHDWLFGKVNLFELIDRVTRRDPSAGACLHTRSLRYDGYVAS